MEHFSDRLRHARKLRKLSQAALAKASGLSQGAISSYENRTRQATTGIIQLAQALNVNPVWLDTGAGPMEMPLNYGAIDNVTRQLRDLESQPVAMAWPFRAFKPGDYWSLTEPKRQIFEKAALALLEALREDDSDTENQR